jgi:hypothetical protein
MHLARAKGKLQRKRMSHAHLVSSPRAHIHPRATVNPLNSGTKHMARNILLGGTESDGSRKHKPNVPRFWAWSDFPCESHVQRESEYLRQPAGNVVFVINAITPEHVKVSNGTSSQKVEVLCILQQICIAIHTRASNSSDSNATVPQPQGMHHTLIGL